MKYNFPPRPPSKADHHVSGEGVWLALILLTLGAAGLRFYHLGASSLWADELATWLYSSADSFSLWKQQFYESPEPFPGTYYLFYHFWIRWIGECEWLLRLPSALASVASVPALFFLARRLTDERVALISAGLFALSWRQVFSAQDARPYAFLFLFSCLFASAAIAIAHSLRQGESPSNREIFLFAGAGLALTQLHYFGILLFALGVAWLIVEALVLKKAPPFFLWGTVFISLICFWPWMNRLMTHVVYSSANDTIKDRTLLSMMKNFFKNTFFFEDGVFWWSSVAAYWLLLFCLAGNFIMVFKKHPLWRRSSLLLIIAWVLVPLILVWLKSEWSQPAYRARYLTIVMPAMYILAATGLVGFIGYRRRILWSVVAAVIVCLLIHLVQEAGYFTESKRRKISEAFNLANQEISFYPETRFFTCISRINYPLYYLQHYPEAQRSWVASPKCSSDFIPQPVSKSGDRLFYLFNATPIPEDFLQRMKNKGWRLIRDLREVDFQVYVFDSDRVFLNRQ